MMDADTVVTVGRQAMEVTMLLAAPILLSSLAVGLIIAMFQAATQINEMTLSFIPKIITTKSGFSSSTACWRTFKASRVV